MSCYIIIRLEENNKQRPSYEFKEGFLQLIIVPMVRFNSNEITVVK